MGGTAFLKEDKKKLEKITQKSKIIYFGRNVKTMNDNVLN